VPAFFEADFFADFFAAAGFARATVFFFLDAFFAEDFLALIFCLLPAVFLLAFDLRDAAAFLPVPARFCLLLAAFFAGMFHSCRSEKNAELYIGCSNMEAQNPAFFRGLEPVFRRPGGQRSRAGPASVRLDRKPIMDGVRDASRDANYNSAVTILRRKCRLRA
jgi:hypothetical protein